MFLTRPMGVVRFKHVQAKTYRIDDRERSEGAELGTRVPEATGCEAARSRRVLHDERCGLAVGVSGMYPATQS